MRTIHETLPSGQIIIISQIILITINKIHFISPEGQTPNAKRTPAGSKKTSFHNVDDMYM